MRVVVASTPEWGGGRPESVRIALLTVLERIARADVRTGEPLATLLDVVNLTGSDLLIFAARGARGLRGALLGSVAVGALNRSSTVLVVR